MTVDDRALVAKQKHELKAFMESQVPDFTKALGGEGPANKLLTHAYLDIRTEPKKMAAALKSPLSLFEALLACAQLHLVPGSQPGHIYLIAYGDEINAQPGYKGWIQCGLRSERIVPVARQVHQGDEFEVDYGGNRIHHIPKATCRSKDTLIGTYCQTMFSNGLRTFSWLDLERIEYHRKHSKASNAYRAGKTRNQSPWETHFEMMAQKSAVLEQVPVWPHRDEFESLSGLEAKADDVPEYAAMQKDKAGDPNDITKIAAGLQDMMDREAAEDAAKEGP